MRMTHRRDASRSIVREGVIPVAPRQFDHAVLDGQSHAPLDLTIAAVANGDAGSVAQERMLVKVRFNHLSLFVEVLERIVART